MGAISTSSPDLWLKADAITGLSDGAAVATWVDSSGNSRDGSQPTSGNRPIFKTGILNGLPVVRFDGVDDSLNSSASTSASSQTIVALVKAGGTGYRGIRGSSGTTGLYLRVDQTTNLPHADLQGSQGIGDASTAINGAWHLIVLTFIAGSFYSYRVDGDNIVYATGAGAPGAGHTTMVGGRAGASEYFNGDMAELLSWSRVLTAAEIAGIESEIAAKWALTGMKGWTALTSLTATASSAAWPALGLFNKSLNGDAGNAWSASGVPPQWVKGQFSTAFVATSYSIGARNDAGSSAPSAWTFEGSNDNSSWTTLDTQSAQTFSNGQTRTYTVSNSTAYSYYRLSITAAVGGGGTWPSFGEWTLLQTDAVVASNFDGTVAATSATEGAVSVVPTLAGQVDGSSTVDGAITANLGVAGQADAVSAVEGAVTSKQNVAGQVDAVTTIEGVFTSGVNVSVAGQVDAVSDTEGDLSLTFLLDGQVDATSAVEGDVTVSPGIAGRVDAVSGTQGSISLPDADEAESYTDGGADVTGPITVSPDTAEAYAGSGIDVAAPIDFDVDQIDAYAEAWATAYDSLDVALDPDALRPQYRLKVVDRFGNVQGELTDAVNVSPATRTLNGRGGLEFDLPKNSDQLALVPQFAEVQVWRGAYLVPGGWFTIVDPSVDAGGDTFRFQCLGLSYYFERAYIGKERPELLLNGGFEQGAKYWGFSWSPGSNAETPPLWEITDDALEGGKALRVFADDKVTTVERTVESAAVFVPNSATFLSGGEQAIRDQVEDLPDGTHVLVEGHTADSDGGTGYALSLARAEAAKTVILAENSTLVVTTVGKGETEPVDPRHTEDAYRKNRRVVIIANVTQTKEGHRQFAGQVFTYVNTTGEALEIDVQAECRVDEYEAPSKDGRMLYADVRLASAPNIPLNDGEVRVDEYTPVGRWLGQECTVKVPAGGLPYRVNVRLFPTAGSTSFDQVSAKPNLKLTYSSTDPRHVIGGLVEHAQDPAFAKGDFNIQPFGPLSGFTIDRSWEWKEHKPVMEAISDVVTSRNGPDANIAVTPTRRLLVIHPKQGRDNGIVLAAGDCAGDARIVAYAAGLDGDEVATTAIVQSSWSGGGMSEVWAREARADGLVLEKLYHADQDTPTPTLLEQARTAVQYGRADVVTRVVMHPDDTTLLMERVTIGDIVTLAIVDGGVEVNATYRITQIDLDPNADQLTYSVALEV